MDEWGDIWSSALNYILLRILVNVANKYTESHMCDLKFFSSYIKKIEGAFSQSIEILFPSNCHQVDTNELL